nr:hypothetical protein GCM10025699_34610 [Microbacterium flavescens]
MTGADSTGADSTGALSIGVAAAVGADVAARLAPAVEAAGFHALWVNDTPGNDALAVLAAPRARPTRSSSRPACFPSTAGRPPRSSTVCRRSACRRTASYSASARAGGAKVRWRG